MPPRGYVLVFFCWALLTVITPTLICWSAAQPKQNAGTVGKNTNEFKVNRRMMGSFPGSNNLIKTQAPCLAPVTAVDEANFTYQPQSNSKLSLFFSWHDETN